MHKRHSRGKSQSTPQLLQAVEAETAQPAVDVPQPSTPSIAEEAHLPPTDADTADDGLRKRSSSGRGEQKRAGSGAGLLNSARRALNRSSPLLLVNDGSTASSSGGKRRSRQQRASGSAEAPELRGPSRRPSRSDGGGADAGAAAALANGGTGLHGRLSGDLSVSQRKLSVASSTAPHTPVRKASLPLTDDGADPRRPTLVLGEAAVATDADDDRETHAMLEWTGDPTVTATDPSDPAWVPCFFRMDDATVWRAPGQRVAVPVASPGRPTDPAATIVPKMQRTGPFTAWRTPADLAVEEVPETLGKTLLRMAGRLYRAPDEVRKRTWLNYAKYYTDKRRADAATISPAPASPLSPKMAQVLSIFQAALQEEMSKAHLLKDAITEKSVSVNELLDRIHELNAVIEVRHTVSTCKL